MSLFIASLLPTIYFAVMAGLYLVDEQYKKALIHYFVYFILAVVTFSLYQSI